MALALRHDRVGVIHYVLRNDAGVELDSTTGREPLAYLHGHRNIVPGLEAALAGSVAGDAMSVSVAPSEGYGERRGDGAQRIRRNTLPKEPPLQVGMPVHGQDGEGQFFTLWVTDIRGAWVWVDLNHPLAGQRLHFEVEVLSVREALETEKRNGRANGVDAYSRSRVR